MTQKRCMPCEGMGKPYNKEQTLQQLENIPGWFADSTYKTISREFLTRSFMAAIKFVNKVADLAESENHHPDIHLTGYRKLRIDLCTHAIGGLSENDFIMAAKINELPVELKK